MSDRDIIRAIEKEIGRELPKVKRVEWNTVGYVQNDAQDIIGISLYECQLNELTKLIIHLRSLASLQKLNLDKNQLTDVSPLAELKNLQLLYLNKNQLRDVSPLSELKNLQDLDLYSNQLTDVSPLTELKNLQQFNLNSNQLTDISPLAELKNLQHLYLNYNQLTDVSPLAELKKLQHLYLSLNLLTDVSPLAELKNLKELDLSRHQLTDVSLLAELKNMKELYLHSNQLTDVSPLAELKNLKELYLNYNLLTDVSPLAELKNLQQLDLRNNKLISLPQEFLEFETEIVWKDSYKIGSVNLYGNPLAFPPIEIVKQGKEAIKTYFDSLKEETVILNEVKILLVGEGMAGKTSLLKQFQDHDFDQKESQTHGINVVSLLASKVKGLEKVTPLKDATLHFWDFGGQEIMHASHQFFLTQRSLYILLIDSRTDSRKDYWLRHIQKFGGDSPLIVVMNKVDENPNYNIAQDEINKKFDNIQNRFHRISCLTGKGYPSLMECIAETIPQTGLFGTAISLTWMKIKETLVEKTKKGRYLNREEFVNICHQHGVDKTEEQNILLQFLNDLGIVLHFQRLHLAKFCVLDPHWVTIGIYKILNSSKVEKGILYEHELDYILNQEKVKKQEYDPAKKKVRYSQEEQAYLLSIMEEFELCFPYGNDTAKAYLLPNLLPKELKPAPLWEEEGCLTFVLAYDYLPSNLMSSLMYKRKAQLIADKQWRYGMLLKSPLSDCQALIKEQSEQKHILISIKGESYEKRDYLSSIRETLAEINSTFQNLKVSEHIPLPDHPDHLIEYEELLGYERNGKENYFVGKLGKEYSVAELLDSIISKQERQEDMSEKGRININISNVGNSQQHVSQDNKQEVNQKVSQEQQVSQEVQLHMQEMLGAFQNLLDDIADEVEIEVEDEKEQKRITKEIEKVQKALVELEESNKEGTKEISAKSKSKIAQFFDDLTNKDSRLRKGFNLVEDGAKKLKKVASYYSLVAPSFGLPAIPTDLLGG